MTIHTGRLDIITTIDQHRRDTITIITTDHHHLTITITIRIMAIAIILTINIDLIAINRSDLIAINRSDHRISDHLRRSVGHLTSIAHLLTEVADKKYNEI
jgi:hypothetical protein